MSKYGPNSKVLGKISIKIEPPAEAEAVHTEIKPHFWSLNPESLSLEYMCI